MKIIEKLLLIVLVLFLASSSSYSEPSQSEKNIIDLAKWQEGTNFVGEEFILGSGEINRSGWGGYSPNERKYFNEFLPGNFDRTLALDNVDWSRGIDWVFTGPRASIKIEIRKKKVDLTITYYDSEGFDQLLNIEKTRNSGYPNGLMPTKSFEYTGLLQAVSVKTDYRLNLSLWLNGIQILSQVHFPDMRRHQLRLVGNSGIVKARMLSPGVESVMIDVNSKKTHQTMLGWGGIGIATAYQELSEKGKDLWWKYISEYNLLCQREYPVGANLNESMDNWDHIEEAKAHYYGDNFPNGEVSDFAYNKTIQDMGGFIMFEFWDFPKWIGTDEHKYTAAMVNYCKTAKEKTGQAPRIVGVQNEIKMKEDEVQRFVPALRKALDGAGFSETKIHMGNSANIINSMEQMHKYTDNKEVWDNIDYAATNMYDFQRYLHEPDDYDDSMIAWYDRVKEKPVISTELCINYKKYQTDCYRIALSMGLLYHKNLTITNAIMICYCWTILNNEQPSFGYTRTLFSSDPESGFLPKPTSNQLRVFGAFSRRIKEGMKRIDVKSGHKDLLVTAFKGSENQATLVMINRSQFPIKPQLNWASIDFNAIEITDPYNQNTVMPANIKDLVISPGAIVTLTNVPLNSFGDR
jgi:hypothetical protein